MSRGVQGKAMQGEERKWHQSCDEKLRVVKDLPWRKIPIAITGHSLATVKANARVNTTTTAVSADSSIWVHVADYRVPQAQLQVS
jgi:hypothetical protein